MSFQASNLFTQRKANILIEYKQYLKILIMPLMREFMFSVKHSKQLLSYERNGILYTLITRLLYKLKITEIKA